MSSHESGEIVLVTGGSGFIGQHLIKQLLLHKDELAVREVRSVDLVEFEDTIGFGSLKDLRTYIGDICQPDTLKECLRNVDTVFHCAAEVSIEYPPNFKELERVNVDGTRTIIDLCVRNNVKRLVFTSCASVCLVPFKGRSTFSIVINQTESKASTPKYDAQNPGNFDKSFLIAGYSASKMRAEQIVLNSNGAILDNQKDYLSTVAIRPPMTYGEGDKRFVPGIFSYLSRHRYTWPRIAGAGGKQQMVYAGNLAWGHICAYKTLKSQPKVIAGLPVFITDETPINDVMRFTQKIALQGGKFKVNTSAWYVPHFLFFLLCFIAELFIGVLYPLTKFKLKYSLRSIASYTASVLMFNRLRASIHIDYAPIIEPERAIQQSATWYRRWHDTNIGPLKR